MMCNLGHTLLFFPMLSRQGLLILLIIYGILITDIAVIKSGSTTAQPSSYYALVSELMLSSGPES